MPFCADGEMGGKRGLAESDEIRRLIVLGAAPCFTMWVLKAWTSRIEPRRTFMKSSGHFQPMNSTKAITSPREARCVCCDLRRPTQASKMAATEA